MVMWCFTISKGKTSILHILSKVFIRICNFAIGMSPDWGDVNSFALWYHARHTHIHIDVISFLFYPVVILLSRIPILRRHCRRRRDAFGCSVLRAKLASLPCAANRREIEAIIHATNAFAPAFVRLGELQAAFQNPLMCVSR